MSLPKQFLNRLEQYQTLSQREQEVFVCLFVDGMSRQQIAQALHISESSVSTSLSGIYRKFSIASDVGRGKENHLRDYLTREYSKWTNSNPENVESQPLEIDQLVQQARSQLQPYIHKRCGTMRVLDMEQPIALTGEQSIYTRVNILEKIAGRRRLSLADLFQDADGEAFDRFGLTPVTERIPGLDAVQRYPKLIVLGKPGAGKTTFLKFLAMQCINGQILADHVPFFVTLKDFAEADDRPDLLTYCDRLIDLPTVGAIRESPLHPIVQSGRAVMILDGLDEVREEDTDRVLSQIQHVAERFPDNQFVITCRIAAKEYTSRFEQFTEVEVADFDNEQIAIFVNNWFRCKEPDRAEEWAKLMLEQLKANEPIKELATNPLLLTLLCLVFEETRTFPQNRADLYEQGVEKLLREWNPRARARDVVYKKLSPDYREELLRHIAWKTFQQKSYFFRQRDVGRLIREFIQGLPGISPEDLLRLDSKAVLDSIEAQHGLLVERAQGIYSFSHRPFHEYFAAREIVLASRVSVGAIRESPLQRLVNHITEKRWREIFLLTAEMLPNADNLVQLMKAQIDGLLVEDEKLQQFLKWVDEKARSVKTSYKLAAFRAIYFAFALDYDAVYMQVRDQGRALSRYFANIPPPQPHEYINGVTRTHHPALALDVVLGRVYVPRNRSLVDSVDSELRDYLRQLSDQVSNRFSQEVFESWWQEHGEIWIEQVQALKIWSVYDEQFSLVQKESLEQYYDANLLLVNCLNSDCYVSRSLREEIEETLLLPIAEIETRKREKDNAL